MGSLFREGSLSSGIGSLFGGLLPWASLQGRGLCPEEGVSIQGSLSGGGGLFTGVFVQRGLSRGSLSREVDL